jgi:hypothetical protein
LFREFLQRFNKTYCANETEYTKRYNNFKVWEYTTISFGIYGHPACIPRAKYMARSIKIIYPDMKFSFKMYLYLVTNR